MIDIRKTFEDYHEDKCNGYDALADSGISELERERDTLTAEIEALKEIIVGWIVRDEIGCSAAQYSPKGCQECEWVDLCKGINGVEEWGKILALHYSRDIEIDALNAKLTDLDTLRSLAGRLAGALGECVDYYDHMGKYDTLLAEARDANPGGLRLVDAEGERDERNLL